MRSVVVIEDWDLAGSHSAPHIPIVMLFVSCHMMAAPATPLVQNCIFRSRTLYIARYISHIYVTRHQNFEALPVTFCPLFWLSSFVASFVFWNRHTLKLYFGLCRKESDNSPHWSILTSEETDMRKIGPLWNHRDHIEIQYGAWQAVVTLNLTLGLWFLDIVWVNIRQFCIEHQTDHTRMEAKMQSCFYNN